MKDLFKQRRIFLVGGPGGVGKTTLSASLGVALSKHGYRTAVLTVDPARRLAQALGFSQFQSELQEIPVEDAAGKLWASMLESERYLDRVITKFAKTPEQRDKILANPLYRTMVESLGGSHEYAAMEQLLELAQDSRFDKVVIDTPPSDNALELFEAPQRLADFMDGSVLKWFQGEDKPYLKFFRTGTRLAMNALKLVFGSQFLDQLSGFLSDLEGMHRGFRERNLQVIQTIQSPECAFVLVTKPSEMRFLDSQRFVQTLREKRISLDFLVLNQMEPKTPQALPSLSSPKALSHVAAVIEYQGKIANQQQAWARRISELASCEHLQIPRHCGPLHDVRELAKLGESLVE